MSNNTEGKVAIASLKQMLAPAIAQILYAQGASILLGRRLLYVLTKLNCKTLH